ncbi:MAG: FAD-binding protein [Eggerthellaceae bacterium]|nr:FAD-binding protein [Eggerthellaceae bacterium]
MSIESLEKRLVAVLEANQILRNEPMARHTTFKVGGPADLFVAPSSVDEVCACVAAAQEEDVPWRMLGAGSNVLVSDEGVRGVVIH